MYKKLLPLIFLAFISQSIFSQDFSTSATTDLDTLLDQINNKKK